MRVSAVEGPTVWTAEQLSQDPTWTYRLTELQQEEIRGAFDRLDPELPLAEISADAFELPGLGSVLDSLIDTIEGGYGVALVRGLPLEGMETKDIERLFYGVASHIGYPEPQDRHGTLLHHVHAKQTFSTPSELAAAFKNSPTLRGYEANGPIDFHTDGSDVLIFLCLQAARVGGSTRIVSGACAFNSVLKVDPELAVILQGEFSFDARGELGAERPYQSAPIFMQGFTEMTVLYKRAYIELASRIPGVAPLTHKQTKALDALDEALSNPKHFYESDLRPGDIMIVNNYEVLHSRTHYRDHENPTQKRHMMRIWATLRRKRRILPEATRGLREFTASWHRRMLLNDLG
jgi:hypothetical protein